MSSRPGLSHPAVRAGIVSLVAGVVIFAAKLAAYLFTGSMALLADAAESIVNVVAAGVLTYSVAVSRRPPDADHPYGHGKAEPLSAMAEGALISGAALFIGVEAVRRILTGQVLEHTTEGMVIAGAAGVGNFALGLYLLAVGRRQRSEALRADGVHVLTDTVTTAASIAALIAVRLTGWPVIDPLVALALGVNLLWAGWRIVRRALTGLLDEADFELLERLAARLEETRRPEWCDIHQLRSRIAGDRQHLDLHLVVPRYFSMEEAHRVGDALEQEIAVACAGEADFIVHLDPCRSIFCTGCAMPACPVRAAALEKPADLSVERLTRPGPI
jgi:cation diffusion facilitator family transporter